MKPRMLGGHLHCKYCGSKIEAVAELPWTASRGVARLGICINCDIAVIQREYRPHGIFSRLKWFKLK